MRRRPLLFRGGGVGAHVPLLVVGDVAGVRRDRADDRDDEARGGEGEDAAVLGGLARLRLPHGRVLLPHRVEGDLAEVHRDGGVEVELPQQGRSAQLRELNR